MRGWDAVDLGRKSYLGQAEIACFWLFRDVKVIPRLLCATTGVERFFLCICRAAKKCRKCVLEVESLGERAGLD